MECNGRFCAGMWAQRRRTGSQPVPRACEDTAVGMGGVGGWVRIPLSAWLVSCVLLVLAHVATRSSAARSQRRWVGGCARRRLHNFGQMDCSTWPAHRFGVLLGSRGERRGRPARVRRPAVGSPKELARGNWHASIYGRAVTGARTDGDVGGCLGTGGAREGRSWSGNGGEEGEEICENRDLSPKQ